MSGFLKGVRLPHRKTTADKSAVRMPAPKTVTIPMSMHIGAHANLLVKAGDIVKVGTLIGEGSGAVSSDIYASVSGKVTKIEEMMPEDIVVLELSSFQLMNMKISPNISVITNITPNHLNIHTDIHLSFCFLFEFFDLNLIQNWEVIDGIYTKAS